MSKRSTKISPYFILYSMRFNSTTFNITTFPVAVSGNAMELMKIPGGAFINCSDGGTIFSFDWVKGKGKEWVRLS